MASDFFLFFTASGGQLETLQWLRTTENQRFELGDYDFSQACRGGNLEVMKWFRSEGCPWGTMACRSAAEYGQLAALQWLRREGCPWNENACYGAASGGHLEMKRRAVSQLRPVTWRC